MGNGGRAVVLVALLLLLVACGTRGDTWARISREGVLRVGLDPTYPPFENADGAPLHGADVDLAHALAADLGLRAEFVHFGYDGLYDALATEQVDVLISALVVAPERGRDFAYSEPYFNAGQVLVTRAEDSAPNALTDLNGRTLAVELGAEGHVIATTWERRLPDLVVVTHDSPDAALAGVADGAADAGLVDHVSARLYRAAAPGLRVAPEPVSVEPYALAVRIDDQVLLQQLNGSLARLRASGRLDAIFARWLDAPP